MKKIIILFLVLTLTFVFVGCSKSPEEENKGDIQTVYIEAHEYGFSPEIVEVNKGQVKLVVENKGTRMHGFGIDELDLDIRLAPGEKTEKIIQVDEPGTYDFYCTVLCGTMGEHSAMEGQIIVK